MKTPQNTSGGSFFVRHWLPVIAVAALMFFLSAQPDLRSPFPGEYDFILRKIAHITEYGLFGFFLMRALRYGHKMPLREATLITLGIGVLYAASDEYHQKFVHGRHDDVLDVLIDTAGAGIGIFIAGRWQGFLKRLSSWRSL